MRLFKLISFFVVVCSSDLSAAQYSDGSCDYKLPDEIGNLFKTKDKKDRQYGKAGQHLKDEKYTYSYDALGRRLSKTYEDQTTHFVWDGNVPLHEWTSSSEESIFGINITNNGRLLSGAEVGELDFTIPKNLTAWIFEDGTFIPMAKLQGENTYSIITDHLGTPTEAYDQ